MTPKWSRTVPAMSFLLIAITGCATSKDELLPHGEATMLDIWSRHTGDSQHRAGRQLLDARLALRRPLNVTDVTREQYSYTRTAQTEIESQFRRLPNPDLVMYVFPHLSGSEQIPIPGYSTVFPMHSRVEYAMPGERAEDY